MRFALLLALCAAPPAMARPVVVELFTSESCSSCPPADAVLVDLAQGRPDVLPLGFHVDYWDRLGWKDRYSSMAATERQRRYDALIGGGVFTPEIVVDGVSQQVGSDRAAVLDAIAAREAAVSSGPAVALTAEGNGLAVRVGAGEGSGALWLVGFDRAHTTEIGGGENDGRTIAEANVVRSLAPLGTWHGAALALHAARPQGERQALLVQAPGGAIIGAAVVP